MIFGQQRDQFRQVFVDVWCKHTQGVPLEPLEHAIAALIDAHSQFHGMLADPDSLVRDFPVEGDEVNPFLHIGMHITIVEQITSDRLAGIRALYDALRERFHDTHELEHAMMQCLAESLHHAQARNQAPDEQGYLAFDVVFAEPEEASALALLDELEGAAVNDPVLRRRYEQLRPRFDRDKALAESMDRRNVILGVFFTGEGSSGGSQTAGELPRPLFPRGSFTGRRIPFVSGSGYAAN